MTMVSVMRAALGFTMLAGLAVTPALAQQPPAKPRPAAPVAAAPAANAAAGARVAQVPAAPRPAQQQQAAAPPPAAAAPIASGSKSSGEVIARVGHFELTADDIKAQLAGVGAREQSALVQNPGLFSQMVKLMLANKLALEQAQEKKFDQQPAIAAQLERMRENAITELYLATVSAPPAGFPSDDEVQKVYDANKSTYVIPRAFQLSQIVIALPKGADKAAEDKAKAKVADVAKKVKAPGADFAAIAKSDSEVGAEKGGEVGLVAENQLPGEIRAQVVALAKGAVSEPLQLEDGWHIIKVNDIKASSIASLQDIKDQLVANMRNERASALRRAFIADLLNKNQPVVNEFALSKLVETK